MDWELVEHSLTPVLYNSHQLGLHWKLSRRKCESNNMMEYVSIYQLYMLMHAYTLIIDISLQKLKGHH